tara:strand:+ start:3703 stop:4395 length:693 start_codon:yes stop_codon:yes gene_type:complete
MLDEHPDIYMAKPISPEPKYFLVSDVGKISYEIYKEKYFSDAGSVSWCGEKSTSYIESPHAAKAIYKMFPEAKIIIMLRNPVDRAISNYKFSKKNGFETLPIDEAMAYESKRQDWKKLANVSVSPFAYKQRGIYVRYIDLWVELFGSENLMLLVSENLIGKRDKIQKIYERLQVDDSFLPKGVVERVNATDKNSISLGLRKKLEVFFSPWNKELERKYGLDLSVWGKPND